MSKADETVQIQIDEQGRVTAAVEELERVQDAWALAIGRFIVTFASCEYWTYLFIRTFGSEAEAEAAHGQRLSRRLGVMGQVVARLRLTLEVQARADAAIARFRNLTPTRNLLAHNAPMVNVYAEREDGSGAMEVRHELRSARDPSIDVTIKQLERDFAEAKAVDEELMLLFGLVRKPENRQR